MTDNVVQFPTFAVELDEETEPLIEALNAALTKFSYESDGTEEEVNPFERVQALLTVAATEIASVEDKGERASLLVDATEQWLEHCAAICGEAAGEFLARLGGDYRRALAHEVLTRVRQHVTGR